VIGAAPAVLTLAIRWLLHEPEQWEQARERAKENAAERTGRVVDLFAPTLVRNTLVGLILATVGLATFWGVHIYGMQLLRSLVEQHYAAMLPEELVQDGKPKRAVLEGKVDEILELLPGDRLPEEKLAELQTVCTRISGNDRLFESADTIDEKTAAIEGVFLEQIESVKRWEMLGMFLVTTGGGLGLVSFGPICERIGRRATFLFFHVGGLASALVMFQGMSDVSPGTLCWMLPLFGYLTLGMHAGYAIYFPELFPTRLRGTGGGFCFNGGRFLAASILLLRGWMRDDQGLGLSLESTASILSLLFLVGIVMLLAAPETKGRDLPT
jgi:hypothetical protein